MAAPTDESGVDLIREETLLQITLDLETRKIQLRFREVRCEFEGIRSSTLLAAWDGEPGRVEFLRRVHHDPDFGWYELRLHFGEIPRNYRIVARSHRLVASSERNADLD